MVDAMVDCVSLAQSRLILEESLNEGLSPSGQSMSMLGKIVLIMFIDVGSSSLTVHDMISCVWVLSCMKVFYWKQAGQ